MPCQQNGKYHKYRPPNSLAQYGQQELLKQHENLEWKYIRKGKYNMNENLE
jgi:hypothetical protein